MDLSTRYMGLELAHPLMVGASPLSDHVDLARKAEDAGAAAFVMRSLFEEQLALDQVAMHTHTDGVAHSHPEAASYFPEPPLFGLGPERYLEQVGRLKEALDIPVIASLNGTTQGGWVRYARELEAAGADGLELNVYHLAFQPEENPYGVEERHVRVLESVRAEVRIPVAVKLSPFFSAPIHMFRRLTGAGADGLVLFNRFYQPDIDIDALEVSHTLELSEPEELRLRLQWLAAAHTHVPTTFAVTGGVHSGRDALKALMAGADAVQMTSALLRHGPEYIGTVKQELVTWMEAGGYESVRQMIGSMSLARCPDPRAYSRGNYMRVLGSWHVEH